MLWLLVFFYGKILINLKTKKYFVKYYINAYSYINNILSFNIFIYIYLDLYIFIFEIYNKLKYKQYY